MKKLGITLCVLLSLLAGSVLAQKYVSAAGKPMHHSAPYAHAEGERRPRQSLDSLYSAAGLPLLIPDLGTVRSTITINDDVPISDLLVHVAIRHTWVRDLTIVLISPDTTLRDTLLTLLPIDSAVNLSGWFIDGAGISIEDVDTPWVARGSWRPADSLARFNGLSARGTWTLSIHDIFARDSGYLDDWELDVNPLPVLRGTVVNSYTNAPVREAKVELLHNSLFTFTNSDGHYEFLTVDSSGLDTVRFTKRLLQNLVWYDVLQVNGVSLSPGSTVQMDTTMTTPSNQWEFATAGGPVSIPDVDTTGGQVTITPAVMSLSIPVDVAISGVAVMVNITHTYDGDLSFWLHSPSEDSIMLARREGGSGQNFTDCYFADSAALLISAGTAPFTGFFRPETPLLVLSSLSRPTAGTWTLTVVDSGPGDAGAIQNFALEVTGAQIVAVDPHSRKPLPQSFTFDGNFPNPFNSRTEFRFELVRRGRVELRLFNLLGQQAAQITDAYFDAGSHSLSFDAAQLASGVYVARFTVDGTASQSRKVLLLK